jgi:hypothetical protein
MLSDTIDISNPFCLAALFMSIGIIPNVLPYFAPSQLSKGAKHQRMFRRVQF